MTVGVAPKLSVGRGRLKMRTFELSVKGRTQAKVLTSAHSLRFIL